MSKISISTLQGGKYQIESLLGSGGFGNTYLAQQVALGRKVAVKEFFMKEYCNREETTSRIVIPTEGSRQIVDKYKQKFLKEAQMIASLKNEHIIQIYDIFEENDTAYYVMEYIEGGSLSEKVERDGAMSEENAFKYILQLSKALSYLHSNNILHLDVKPANILLDSKDRAVLIDFGISKHYDEEGGQTSTTPAGISKGYAPIEQYQQGSITGFTPSTDVYSVGATLLNLLTGEVPPEASAIYEDGLPESADRLNPETKKLIQNAMAPRRKDRYQSIEAFIGAINSIESISSETSCSSTIKEMPSEETTVLINNQDKPKQVENDVKTQYRPPFKQQINEEDEITNEPIRGWMAFFLWAGIGLSVIVSVIQLFISADIVTSLVFACILGTIGIKTIIAFYKKHDNAIALATTYCIIIGIDAIITLLINIFTGNFVSLGYVLRNILWSSIWLTYLYCSYEIKDRFPNETRVWHNFEKFMLLATTCLYILIFTITIASTSSTNKKPATSKPKVENTTKVTTPSTKPKNNTSNENKQVTTSQKQPSTTTTDTNATKLKEALQRNDYKTVKQLADAGYSPAYLPLAKHYLKDPASHNLADKYARKALNAGIKSSQDVIDDLEALGFYD